MTIDKIFYAYMALVGLAAGALLVARPQAGEAFIKPYFWMLLAVAAFDAVMFYLKRISPAEVMPLQVRVFGFIGGTLIVAAVIQITGSPAKLF